MSEPTGSYGDTAGTFADRTNTYTSERMDGDTPLDTVERATQIGVWISDLYGKDRDLAPLRARYGPGGTFDHERKVLLASFRDEARLGKLHAGEKTTEAALDDVAHSHPGYQEFIERALTERTQMALLEAERVRLDGLIALYRSMIYFDGRVAGLGGG